MTELTFSANPQSRGAIVRWMLEEVGAPDYPVVLDNGPAMKTPGFLAINPMGKVPLTPQIPRGRGRRLGMGVHTYQRRSSQRNWTVHWSTMIFPAST
jgi:hypothetical protein